ncbi:hypothetical protein BC830DRAFT_1080075 [Chytriomyces sp. MP71]|nr:hypothetical protein BC830DRAFT_1080075 [Chytriomyces sp. MP71]
MFMPWEQLNNQLIGLKSTCAIARLLNRTMVLPLLGQRKPDSEISKNWDFSFQVMEFSWHSMYQYFDGDGLDTKLPCSTISLSNFNALSRHHAVKCQITLDRLVFNPVAKATAVNQIEDYYGRILGYDIGKVDDSFSRMSQLQDSQIRAYFGNEEAKVLALGAAFWMYGFGRTQPYPLTRYENYMDDADYARMVGALDVSKRLRDLAIKATQFVREEYGSKFLAIHVRRGDYWKKCNRIQDIALRAKCFPSDQTVRNIILHEASRMPASKKREKLVVYVATNPGEFQNVLNSLRPKIQVIYYQDVFKRLDMTAPLDSIEAALLDIELCSRADVFFGNIYSSFSRAIFEKRESKGLGFHTF